jgi:hypothetical protein
MTTLFLQQVPIDPPVENDVVVDVDEPLYMVDEPEAFAFVEKMTNAKAIRAAIDTRFFRDVLHAPLQTLYAVKDTNEGFVCKVYTHVESNFVVKYIRDTSPRKLNGKYRWYPELLNHRLAWRLCPERTLAMYAAYVGVEDGSYFFVYERARNLSADEELTRLPEAMRVAELFNGLGLFHLDTKLSNFLVNASGEVCLHDWGMALPVDHGIPGDLMYSDPFGDDASLWSIVSEQAGGRRYSDLILQWTRMCQGRLLLAKIEEAPASMGESLDPAAFRDFTAGVGLGLEDFYNSPVWFKDFHSVLCGFSATIVSRSFSDLFGRHCSS